MKCLWSKRNRRCKNGGLNRISSSWTIQSMVNRRGPRKSCRVALPWNRRGILSIWVNQSCLRVTRSRIWRAGPFPRSGGIRWWRRRVSTRSWTSRTSRLDSSRLSRATRKRMSSSRSLSSQLTRLLLGPMLPTTWKDTAWKSKAILRSNAAIATSMRWECAS